MIGVNLLRSDSPRRESMAKSVFKQSLLNSFSFDHDRVNHTALLMPSGRPFQAWSVLAGKRQGSRDGTPAKSSVARNSGSSYHIAFKHGGSDERLAPGFSLRLSDAWQQRGADSGDCGLSGGGNRRQFGNFQRGGRAAVASVAVSATRPPRGHLAALAGHRHISGLAVSRPVHRSSERKSFVPADGARPKPHLHAYGSRAAPTG